MLAGVDASQVDKTTYTHTSVSQVWARTHTYVHTYTPIHMRNPHGHPHVCPHLRGHVHLVPFLCLLACQSKRERAAGQECLPATLAWIWHQRRRQEGKGDVFLGSHQAELRKLSAFHLRWEAASFRDSLYLLKMTHRGLKAFPW